MHMYHKNYKNEEISYCDFVKIPCTGSYLAHFFEQIDNSLTGSCMSTILWETLSINTNKHRHQTN